MDPVSALSPASTGGLAAREDQERAANTLTADFDTFLRLLTTQLKNQDPLKPMESTEFVAQLAQFSSVEQQIATNAKLSRILDAVSGEGAGALGQWLGREVRAAAPLEHAGGPAEAFPPQAPEGAAGATLVARKADGSVAAEVPFTLGAASVIWDGKLAGGGDAPAGVYRFEARYTMAQGAVETRDAQVFARVVEARLEDGGVVLGLAGGGAVAVEAVSAVRDGARAG